MKEVRDVLKQISELDEKMKIIEDAIGIQTEILKELFLKYSLSMKKSQNYLLTGYPDVSYFKIIFSYL